MSERAERVLFVHAYPGDESISAGATIATLVDHGAAVTVLTCTRAERGAVQSRELEPLASSPIALGARREAELVKALTVLGVTDHRMLGAADARWEGRAPRRYLDSTVEPGHPENPASLAAAELSEVAADIAAVMIDVEPDVVVSYPLDDANSDRDRVHEATRTAAEVIGVAFYVIEPNAVVGAPTVDSMDAIDRRSDALAAFPSRLRIDGDTITDSLGGERPLTVPEHFSRLRPPADAFSDASFMSRVAVCVLAVLLGAIIGAIVTVAHEATAVVGGVSVPWGAIAGILISAGYLLGMRLVFETRIAPVFGAVGLLTGAVYLIFVSSGGALIMRAEPLGIGWAIAAIVAIALVLAWPRSARSRRDRIKRSSAKGPDSP
ncbi:MAG: hypothetical protein EPN91_06855 [Salinibacterium sp.]|nr:MAG: hypothetical protein EPN91_06855 [Salinibacterium sp.]